MRPYPLFMQLEGCRCLVVGAGGVGRRKLSGLLPCGLAEIIVLDTAKPDEDLQRLLDSTCVRFEQRTFVADDVNGCALVFAATGSRQANDFIAQSCRERGVPCNVIDAPSTGSFIVPAHFACGDMVVALSTGGQSPALAKRIRMELQEWFGTRYCNFATLMGRVRPLVLALGQETEKNTTIFRALVSSDLPDALALKDQTACQRVLQDILPPALHPHIVELLHGLI
ncbi:MAG: bifunctional precorrin-2 dehydrogenase/sirohydrochlorin ferrochelatase [Pseudomonadota bacterium]